MDQFPDRKTYFNWTNVEQFLLVKYRSRCVDAYALRQAFGGAFIANEQFTAETAQQVLSEGHADAVAFGKQFIANPDLVTRFQQKKPLNELRADKMYGSGPEGYTDYPALSA